MTLKEHVEAVELERDQAVRQRDALYLMLRAVGVSSETIDAIMAEVAQGLAGNSLSAARAGAGLKP